MDSSYSTEALYDIVSRSESLEEYKQILFNLADQKKAWSQIINEIMVTNGYSAAQLGALCGVSRQSIQKWISGAIPKSRSTFIKVGFAANYDLEQMNHFLQRYGCCNGLYSKNLEDSVCIFVLSSEEIEHSYAMYEKILHMIQAELIAAEGGEATEDYETSSVFMELLKLKTLPQLLEFVQQKSVIYKSAYYRLYEYIESFIQKNLLQDEEDSVYLLANAQEWSSSLRQCVSEISQKKWYPQRNKIISLGIHLNMNMDQINEMLSLAQMERVCAKNPFENAIIYALENAQLEDKIHCDGTSELCIYVKNILVSLHFEGVEFFLDELPDSDESDV